VAVGEDVGLDGKRLARGALGREPAPVDLRVHPLDRHPADVIVFLNLSKRLDGDCSFPLVSVKL
jgi:hypothetical protein